MKTITYIRKYHNDGAKMFCAACRYATGSPVWLVASYYALKAAGHDPAGRFQEIQQNDIARQIYNDIERN